MLPELKALRRMRVGVGRPDELLPLELRERDRPFFELFGDAHRRKNSGDARILMPSVTATGSIVNLNEIKSHVKV